MISSSGGFFSLLDYQSPSPLPTEKMELTPEQQRKTFIENVIKYGYHLFREDKITNKIYDVNMEDYDVWFSTGIDGTVTRYVTKKQPEIGSKTKVAH